MKAPLKSPQHHCLWHENKKLFDSDLCCQSLSKILLHILWLSRKTENSKGDKLCYRFWKTCSNNIVIVLELVAPNKKFLMWLVRIFLVLMCKDWVMPPLHWLPSKLLQSKSKTHQIIFFWSRILNFYFEVFKKYAVIVKFNKCFLKTHTICPL